MMNSKVSLCSEMTFSQMILGHANISVTKVFCIGFLLKWNTEYLQYNAGKVVSLSEGLFSASSVNLKENVKTVN